MSQAGYEAQTADAETADRLKLRVRAIRWEAERIHSFELDSPEGEPLPEAAAGAHIDVHLPGGITRSYSLAGDPLDRQRWVLGVLREAGGRGGSKAMHDKVAVGQMLEVGKPRQAFELVPHAGHTILIAGGIGITPLKSMAHALFKAGQSFELHYCARTAKHAAFLDGLRSLVPDGCLHTHFDEGDPTKGLDIAALLRDASVETHVYYCGPAGFMAACADASAHWPKDNVHFEHFKAPEPTRTDAPDGGFEVHLARQGISVQVQPDQTIVRAIELAGLRVSTSCLSGLCGACKVDYVEGEVEHHDYILSDEEKQRCLTLCVSRARSPRLVLDI